MSDFIAIPKKSGLDTGIRTSLFGYVPDAIGKIPWAG
jgi:hypothetical protein